MRAGTHHCHPSPPCHPLPRHFPSQQQRGEQQCRSQLLPSYNFPPSQLPVGPSNRCPWLQLSPLPRSPLPIPAAGGSHSLPILPQIGGSTARGGGNEAGNTQRALPWGLALASSHGHHHPRAEPPLQASPPPQLPATPFQALTFRRSPHEGQQEGTEDQQRHPQPQGTQRPRPHSQVGPPGSRPCPTSGAAGWCPAPHVVSSCHSPLAPVARRDRGGP